MSSLEEQNILLAKSEGLVAPLEAWQLFRNERENNREKVDCILESNKIVSE